MNERRVIKVVLRCRDGRFLVSDGEQPALSNDLLKAAVFDGSVEEITELLGRMQAAHGLVFQAVPLDPWDLYETCDGCGRRIRSLRAFFDGQQLLCPECRAARASSDAQTRPCADKA